MQYYVYILANKNNNVLYTGVTNNIAKRIYEHKNKQVKGFTSKYNIVKLVYFEATENINSAIAKEKQIKSGSKLKKIKLIETVNPEWRDLYQDLI